MRKPPELYPAPVPPPDEHHVIGLVLEPLQDDDVCIGIVTKEEVQLHAQEIMTMVLKDAMLANQKGSFAQFSDRMRSQGHTYREVCESIRKIWREAGRPEPEDRDIDAWMEDEE